jgi:hypothetical protein
MCRLSLFLYFFMLVCSTCLIAQDNSKWETCFESSGYKGTPSYEETINYFKLYENSFPQVRLLSFGQSAQGRDMICILISNDEGITPLEAKKSGKPLVMIHAGIHAGEIEGKDASMLLLREILVTGEKKHLLDNMNIIIVPVFNVDGHERRSRYNRINQDGPEEMGWRTTANNYNLNRDWLKADAVEMQHMLRLFNQWLPDFLIDCHTSNGADYQYTVTYSLEKYRNIYEGTAYWNKFIFTPYLLKGVEEQGFLIAPYVNFHKDLPDSGLVEYASPPRFSTGYAAIQNRPALLIETHMMKPYKDRVYATLAVLSTTFQYIHEHPEELIKLNNEADKNTIADLTKLKKHLPLSFRLNEEPKQFLYKGIEALRQESSISGTLKTIYTGNKYEKYIPHFDTVDVVDSVQSPSAYLIPQEWSLLVERMKLHGIEVKVLHKEKTYRVKRYKFRDIKYAASSYEGRQTVDCNFNTYSENVTVPAGTYLVPVDQRTIKIIMHLLQPESEDSFLRWGFMNTIFERKEYFESYVMEREAEKMLKDNPNLQKEFEDRLASDKEFRENPYQRLSFFYERSPYFDQKYRVYPVMVVE